MTRNKAYLVEYQDFNGGPVAFEGKFKEKSNEGFLVGYSLNSKAFRVYNLETKRVKENLHINFLENKPNVTGKGPTWLFDLDYLTDSINYQPVTAENKANKTAGPKEANNIAGTQDNIDTGNSKIEAEHVQEYFVLTLWSSYTSTVKSSKAKNRDQKLNGDTGSKTNKDPVDQDDQAFLEELERLKRKAKEADDAAETLRKMFAQGTEDLLLQAGVARASSTNYVNTASTPVNTASTSVNTASPLRNVSAAGPSYPDLLTYANQDDYQIPSLEDIYEVPNDRIFTSASYDAEGAVADFINLESTVNIEPKKISQALEDKSWVDAIQEELLQLTQQVWILVNLRFRKKVIGTKWVYRNKNDERGVIVRNKARLVAQGHRQEERIDYDEVFAPVARIKAIRIFLAFASYMGFIVYQMDVKSAFLYGKINKEVYVSQPSGFIDPKFPKKVSKTASTPIETKKPLVKDAEVADVDVHLYRSMIGSLMYLIASRPDIMYLKGQPKLGIWYPRESAFDLNAYLDSDYAGSNLDRKSTTGVMVSLKIRSLGKEHVSKQGEKAKTGLNIKEGNLNKFDDLVGEGDDYAVNEGRSTDKIKVLIIEAEGVSAAGETLSTTTLAVSTASVQPTDADLEEEEQLIVFLIIIPDEEREVNYAVLDKSKELASLKQTALGKDFLNSLMVDSLPKTIWLSMHHVIAMKHWLFQSKQLLTDQLGNLNEKEEAKQTRSEKELRHFMMSHDLPKLVKEKPKPTSPQAQSPCDHCSRDFSYSTQFMKIFKEFGKTKEPQLDATTGMETEEEKWEFMLAIATEISEVEQILQQKTFHRTNEPFSVDVVESGRAMLCSSTSSHLRLEASFKAGVTPPKLELIVRFNLCFGTGGESAFLYGTIDKEVYISQPPGFVDLKFPNKVYKVVKALYGLHQAPRAFQAYLQKHLKEELTLAELGSHLRIEKSLSVQDSDKPKGNNVVGPSVVNMDDDVAWWVDSRAIVHVCKDRSWFKTYESLNDGSILHMGNESTALVHGRGCVDLRFSSGKIVSLFDVLHVPKIRKNLVLSSILNNYGYKQPLCQSLNCDSILWHARLGHVHFKMMQDMSKGGLIPAFDIDTEKWNKKYFVTFIDDASRFCYVYLLHTKDEALDKFKAEHSKAFWFFVIEPNESVLINSINESKDAIFDENRFLSVHKPSQMSLKDGTEDIGGSVVANLLFANGSSKKLKVDETIVKFKMGMKTAFLNGELEEKVYMNQSWGFIMPGNENKGFLSSRFSMKDMRKDDVIFGIRIKHESNRIAISQSHNIEKVLKKFNYFNCTPVSTPIDTSEKLMTNNGHTVSQLEYSMMTGCLMYVMTCIRPDIAFTVGKLSRLSYTNYPSVLEGYTDASWISDTEYNSSTSGWVFLLGGAAGKEVEWLKNLLLKILLWSKPIAPISIRCDSDATLGNAYS
nr:zinc finger, CCHC-type [Tanacetum cinerariifolium]